MVNKNTVSRASAINSQRSIQTEKYFSWNKVQNNPALSCLDCTTIKRVYSVAGELL